MMKNILEHYTHRDDLLLYTNRLDILTHDEDGIIEKKSFRIKEEGYKYYLNNLKPMHNEPGNPLLRKPGKLCVRDHSNIM